MSRSLEDLQPEFRDQLERAIDAAKVINVHMVPYETVRDVWSQAKLWRRSRSPSKIQEMLNFLNVQGAGFLASVIEEVGPQTGEWATNAIPGLSWHQYGLATDLYWDRNGDEPGGVEWLDLAGYLDFARICKALGLTSGYFWRSRDAVHIQQPKELSPGHNMTIQQISQAMEKQYG
ncbi:MAG: M15 family metallopeptidase [Hyphomonas sp.]|nr:M15 family metallopeptidase [Hyphomonas sp.]